MRRRFLIVAPWCAAIMLLSSCAYYNTYYLAKKYYYKGTDGLPYTVEKPPPEKLQNFTRTIDYSKKLLANYPKSKWVDDGYLLWACALLGTDDPRQSVKLLEDFNARFPKSSLKPDAAFYLGVAYRKTRKYESALRALDDFLAQSPRHKLAPYALLERARVLIALDRPTEASAAASQVLERYPKSELRDVARIHRAEARFTQNDYAGAREDFHELGRNSRDNEQRFSYLLREADCLEGARQYDLELALLKDAIAYEREPAPHDTSFAGPSGGAADHYGRLMLRIGTAHMQSGRLQEALQAYHRVLVDYARTPLATEAQYRIGYAYEAQGEDFDRARSEYARARDMGGSTEFGDQASQRLANLERLSSYKSSAGDSLDKKAEVGFLLAEQYLFQLDKPERAIEEYQKITQQFPGTPQAGKAVNAQAWVLSRKLKRRNQADSLFWMVVYQYPATEAQLAARDYLELDGATVPDSLIKLPEPALAVADTTAPLTPPPAADQSLGIPDPAAGNGSDDMRLGPHPAGLAAPAMLVTTAPRGSPGTPGDTPMRGTADPSPSTVTPPPHTPPQAAAVRDSTAVRQPAAADTTARTIPKPGPAPAPVDTTGAPH